MAIVLTQTDTAADSGTDVGCSGASIAHTPISREATEGGTAGSSEASVKVTTGSSGAAVMFQSDTGTGEPSETEWDAGDYIVRLNVTTGNTNCTWTETHVCERTSGGSFNTVASLTGQTTTLSAGTHSHTVNRGTTFTAVDGNSTLYIVLVVSSAADHGQDTFGFTPDQNIDTPIVASVTHQGELSASSSASTTLTATMTLGGNFSGSATASATLDPSCTFGGRLSGSATASFSALGGVTMPAEMSVSSSGSFSASGSVKKLGDWSVSQAGTFSGDGTLTRGGVWSLSSSASYSGSGTVSSPGSSGDARDLADLMKGKLRISI